MMARTRTAPVGGPGVPASRLPHAAAPGFEPLESKLHPPQGATGTVTRAQLIERLRESRSTPVVMVSAPPGYGKTTLLAQWATRSRRPFAWLSLDAGDNDPVVFLSYLALALDRISPLEPGTLEALTAPDASVEATVVPRLAAAMRALQPSFVLVVDDVHELHDARCVDALDALIDHVPIGSQVALCGQHQPSRQAPQLRARGRVLEIGVDELRMDEAEARELLDAAGVELDSAEIAEIAEHCEGWPAGIYLAGLSVGAGADGGGAAARLSGENRFIADYLRAELIRRLSGDELRFLTRTSVLERVCGPLCDCVLESDDSAASLERLDRANRFVVPLDPDRRWYRYHTLFRELLRAELDRSEPEVAPRLLVRASDWCAANGEPEAAVAYAQAAGDGERVVELVLAHAQRRYQLGRAGTVDRWLDWLEAEGVLERQPLMAAIGAWFGAIRGDSDRTERLADIAQRAVKDEGTAADGPIEPWLALLRAARCERGAARMREDAELALDGFQRSGPWWLTAALTLALAQLIGGEDRAADALLARVVDSGQATGGWNGVSIAIAFRATLAIARDDWPEAERLAEEAGAVARRSRMEDYPPNAIVYAALAQVAVHRGERERAAECLARVQRLRPRLTHVFVPFAVQARLAAAAAYVSLADTSGARTVLREAEGLMTRGADFGRLSEQAAGLRSRLDEVRANIPGSSSLTAAELRLLPLLTTHLSFREIGSRLYLSRHTVKSQAISIYRKLDVTSRNDAVERARALHIV